MTDDYKSTERSLFEIAKKSPRIRRVVEHATDTLKVSYGAFVSPFRIPTFLRKIENEQTIASRLDQLPRYQADKGNLMLVGPEKKESVMTLGMCLGLGMHTYMWYDALKEAVHGHPTQALLLGGTMALTNIVSYAYEQGAHNERLDRIQKIKKRKEKQNEKIAEDARKRANAAGLGLYLTGPQE